MVFYLGIDDNADRSVPLYIRSVLDDLAGLQPLWTTVAQHANRQDQHPDGISSLVSTTPIRSSNANVYYLHLETAMMHSKPMIHLVVTRCESERGRQALVGDVQGFGAGLGISKRFIVGSCWK